MTSTEAQFDVRSATVLRDLFKPEHLRRTIKRMRAWQESENEVAHPLRQILLVEYEDGLAEGLAASVAAGVWSPAPAYPVLVAKRSGTYRELVYPCLVDTIVGRRVIDALEPHITKDDNDKVFFGRSHANADRQRGDYENWFKVWLDFSAQIGSALESDGFTYVFETDITQFFPSVDRSRAKHALAQRTYAHQTLLELLFYCVESWCPRVRYCSVPGLPIEPNDVSRLIAHNYVKGVDEHFVDDQRLKYFRWVDDTVVFAADERTAHDIKRQHHLALREMGLSPNASKTSILKASEYAATRHPDFNHRINTVQTTKSESGLKSLVDEWYAKDVDATPSWDKVATRLYSTARVLRTSLLRQRAIDDIVMHPNLLRAAVKYIRAFELDDNDVARLFAFTGQTTTSIEAQIEIARLLCDARIMGDAQSIVRSATHHVLMDDVRLGSGYARALFLLCVHKYGDKDARDKIRNALGIERLQDDQLRLHFLYVYYCRNELDEAVARAVRHIDTPDIALLMRVCEDARRGKLVKHAKCLAKCLSQRYQKRSIEARYLPFLFAMLRAPGKEAENAAWLKKYASEEALNQIDDAAIKTFLRDELRHATR